VRTLDEAVEEVREDRRERQQNRMRQRDHDRLERARIKAITRQHRGWGRSRGGRQVEIGSGSPGTAAPAGQPVIAEGTAPELPVRTRPALQSVSRPGDAAPRTIDLTAEDDTMTLPRVNADPFATLDA